MDILKAVNSGLAFFLELAMLGSIAYAGFHNDKGLPLQVLFGVGVPILVIVFWGMFMAPNASTRFGLAARVAATFFLFGGAAFALYRTGKTGPAIVFAALTIINQVLALLWKQ